MKKDGKRRRRRFETEPLASRHSKEYQKIKKV